MSLTLHEKLKNFERKQIVASAIGLFILICLSIIFNYIHLSSQASQTAKFISRMIQIEDFREVGITLQEARLDQFTTIRYVSSDPRRSFTLPEISDLMPNRSFLHNLSHDQITVPLINLGSKNGDTIVFEFNRFNEVIWAIAIWFILNLVSIPQTMFMKRKIIAGFNESLQIEIELARAEVAKKVRHNIRTPLSALIRLSHRDSRSSPDTALLVNVIAHIKDLVSELDDPHKTPKPSNYAIYKVLSDTMREVRLTTPSTFLLTTDVEDTLVSAKCQFVDFELRSIITNLVTNSIEAIEHSGKIEISAKDFGDRVLIEIKDNGSGIPKQLLAQVTEKGFSYGKENGTGLGLYHAEQNLAAWGGSLRIKSEQGVGTTTQITIPVQHREPWYVPRIKITANDTIVILDDQNTVHEVWRQRLGELDVLNPVLHFTSSQAALAQLAGLDLSRLLLFADYDLGEKQTGLDFLNELGTVKKKYLVTGHFDDESVQKSCAHHEVSLIPKTMLSEIPIISC